MARAIQIPVYKNQDYPFWYWNQVQRSAPLSKCTAKHGCPRMQRDFGGVFRYGGNRCIHIRLDRERLMTWIIEPFHAPVDWKELGLYDYPQIVKKPMDFGTVREKLESEKYATNDDFIADMRLVLRNCMLYNEVGWLCHSSLLGITLATGWVGFLFTGPRVDGKIEWSR